MVGDDAWTAVMQRNKRDNARVMLGFHALEIIETASEGPATLR
jgi:hypothetical protein